MPSLYQRLARKFHTAIRMVMPGASPKPPATGPPDAQVILSASEISSRPTETFPSSTTEPSKGDLTWHTVFSSPATPTSSLCAGIACCPPLTGHLCAHRHEQAEIYYITEGRGTVTIDGKDSIVSKGSVVFIPGNAEHGIRNESKEEELKWFYVFPGGDFGDVIYRFSRK